MPHAIETLLLSAFGLFLPQLPKHMTGSNRHSALHLGSLWEAADDPQCNAICSSSKGCASGKLQIYFCLFDSTKKTGNNILNGSFSDAFGPAG